MASGQAQDRYHKLRRLGEGGAGQVWLVEDTVHPGSRLALKELADDASGKEDSLRREFATLALLHHPNLAEVFEFDVCPSTGRPRFTLEHIEGTNIVEAAREEGPHLLLDMVAEALRALSFLHDFGLIHRDLKPGNLLVRKEPRGGCRLVVLDFGLALLGRTSEEVRHPAGTLPYLAPELFEGGSASRRSDLYALGVLVHEAIHGQVPYEADGSDLTKFIQIVRSGRRSRPQLPETYPKGLHGWLEELLLPDPANRPSSATEALARLNAACGFRYPMETAATLRARLASGPPPGREVELAQLFDALTPHKAPRVVWLTGEAGSGKTRVLTWLAAEAVRRGWDVIPGLQGKLESDGMRDPKDGVDELIADLRHLALKQPVLVLIDEVETAPSHVIHFLQRIAAEENAPPLQVVAALRPSETQQEGVRRLLGEVTFLPTLARVELGPLDAGAIGKVVERATGGKALSRQRIGSLLEASEGNPLLVETLLVEGPGEGKPSTGREKRLEQSIATRYKSLSNNSKRWLEALALLGRESPDPLLAKVAELREDDAQDAAREAEILGLALRDRHGWSPYSRLISSYVLTEVEKRESRAFQTRAAQLVQEAIGSDAERLAQLWRRAGDRNKSIEWAEKAAEQAEVSGDIVGAAFWCRFGLLQLKRRDQRRRALRLKHAMLLRESDQHRQAVRALATVLRLSRSKKEKCDVLVDLSRALTLSGMFERGRRVAEKALIIAESEDEVNRLARAHFALGLALFHEGRDSETLRISTRAVEKLERVDATADKAELLLLIALAESRLRKLDEARSHFLQALEHARSCENVQIEAKVMTGLGSLEERAGRREEALRWYEMAFEIIELHNMRALEVTLLMNMAVLLTNVGRLDHALQRVQDAEPLSLYLGRRTLYLSSKNLRAEIMRECGRPSEAASMMTELLEGPLDGYEPGSVNYARLTLVEALMESPHPSESRMNDLIAQVSRSVGENPRATLAALIIDLERRARPACDDPFEPAWVAYQEFRQRTPLDFEPQLEIRAQLARAHAFLKAADSSAASEVATTATELAEKMDFPALAARAYAALAEARRREGQKEESAKALEQGRRYLEDAANRIEDLEMRRDFLDRPVFKALRQPAAGGVSVGEDRLLAIYQMIHALNSETDPDAVLEAMLDMALEVVQAERGMILLRSGADQDYQVRLARNLEKETIEDAAQFSRKVVLEAGSGRAVLAIDAGQDQKLREFKSVSMYGIRSVLCVPLRSRGEIIGAVYLDNRKQGALFSPEDLKFLEAFADHAALALLNAQTRRDLERENRRLQAAAEARVEFAGIVGRSAPMQQVFDLITRAAEAPFPVLIQGESGTGKELVARAIHFNSPRSKKPFLTENCASIADSLLESELFGHVRGAFTGAERDRQGLFEQANGGTLFMDEVGDMSAAMQARLLRVLQEGELRRVGGDRSIHVDVRVLAATHRNLQQEVQNGRFREDLFYRLNVLLIQIPPLRERPGDFPLLIDTLLDKIGKARGRPTTELRSSVVDLLESYHWPGNVRQLENTLQRLVVLAGSGPVTRELLESDAGLRQMLMGPEARVLPLYSLERTEKEQIRAALQASGGNRSHAAKLLGISRATIFRKIKEYSLG